MRQKIGIILLERTEIIIRIYEADGKEWKLQHYQNKEFQVSKETKQTEVDIIINEIASFMLSDYAKFISEWKACARYLPTPFTKVITSATGFRIENLSQTREQELICKGMFTELW